MKNGLITQEYVNTVIKRRTRDIHKGDCGRILLAVGSYGMAGAAVLCGRGALRSGAGLVTISAPEEIFPVLQIGVTEATCVSRTSHDWKRRGYDAIAAGPGMGEDERDADLIGDILKNYEGTFVLDADGLNHISRYKMQERLKKASCRVIITPHIGEAARLLDMTVSEAADMDRYSLAAALVEKTGAVTVLKGADTIVATPQGKSYTNTTGNPGMATGGAGDVLTGIIVSLAGQGLNPEDAAKAGVYLHGAAGDLGAERFGEYGLAAGDIADMTALAIKKILG